MGEVEKGKEQNPRVLSEREERRREKMCRRYENERFWVSFLGLSVLCECVFLAVDLGFGFGRSLEMI